MDLNKKEIVLMMQLIENRYEELNYYKVRPFSDTEKINEYKKELSNIYEKLYKIKNLSESEEEWI